MPEVSRFFGIVIKMFFDDHNPPHFHAEYSGYLALIDIRNLSAFSGHLPPRVMGLVIEWATIQVIPVILPSALKRRKALKS